MILMVLLTLAWLALSVAILCAHPRNIGSIYGDDWSEAFMWLFFTIIICGGLGLLVTLGWKAVLS
jgi:hypothetical protein